MLIVGEGGSMEGIRVQCKVCLADLVPVVKDGRTSLKCPDCGQGSITVSKTINGRQVEGATGIQIGPHRL